MSVSFLVFHTNLMSKFFLSNLPRVNFLVQINISHHAEKTSFGEKLFLVYLHSNHSSL